MSRPFEFLRECGRTLGDAFTLDLGTSGIYVLFSHPEAIRTIFTASPAVLHAGKGNAILRPFLGSASLLLLEEEQHQRERRLLMPAFHAKRIEEHGQVIQEAALKMTADWAVGQQVLVQDVMQEISIEVILRAVFGIQGGHQFGELRRELLTFLNDSKFNLALIGQLREDFASQEVWQAFRQRFEGIDALMRREVARRRTGGSEDLTGMLGLLLAATDEEGRGRSDDELRDELLTLVVAGYETTATALSWAMYWIHRTSRVKEALVSALEGMGPRPAAKSVAENPYFDAVCKEVLRITPVIPVVARQVQRTFEVAGFHVPAGVTVSPCIYLAHHREEAFPEPDVFRPERFFERTPSPYEYLPFGGGARRCIGLGLAAYEVKVVLGTILSRFELELADAKPLRPVRRSVTVAPSGGARMIVRRCIP